MIKQSSQHVLVYGSLLVNTFHNSSASKFSPFINIFEQWFQLMFLLTLPFLFSLLQMWAYVHLFKMCQWVSSWRRKVPFMPSTYRRGDPSIFHSVKRMLKGHGPKKESLVKIWGSKCLFWSPEVHICVEYSVVAVVFSDYILNIRIV